MARTTVDNEEEHVWPEQTQDQVVVPKERAKRNNRVLLYPSAGAEVRDGTGDEGGDKIELCLCCCV